MASVTSPMQARLLPLFEACAAGRVSYVAAWRAVVSGAVPATRRGARWYIRLSDLRALAQRERKERAA